MKKTKKSQKKAEKQKKTVYSSRNHLKSVSKLPQGYMVGGLNE